MAKVHCSQRRGGVQHAVCFTCRPPRPSVRFAEFLAIPPQMRCARCEAKLIQLGVWNVFSMTRAEAAAKPH